MKRKFLQIVRNYFTLSVCFLLAAFCGAEVHAQCSWGLIGSAGFTSTTVIEPQIIMNSGGVPFVSFGRFDGGTNGYYASVMRDSSGVWVDYGTSNFSVNKVLSVSSVISSTDTVFVAFSDAANGNGANVMKYDGTSWVNVGSADFSYTDAENIQIATGVNDTLYVVYSHSNEHLDHVMKFNGSTWDSVGTAFAGGGTPIIAVDRNTNTIYVATSDAVNSKLNVKKFDGSNWVDVGSSNISSGTLVGDGKSLAIGSTGIPYVAFADNGNNAHLSVVKFNGSSWVYVGSQNATSVTTYTPSLAIAADGTLFVSYADGSNNGKANVIKFNGSSWQASGNSGFSSWSAYQTSITTYNNVPYITFNDGSNSGEATVMSLQGTLVTPSVSIGSDHSNTICAGTSVIFTATPTNGGSPNYQWYNKSATISGATSVTYTTDTLHNTDSIYVVMISTDPCASPTSVYSNALIITVNPTLVPSVLIGSDHSNPICNGTSVTFTATPTNGGATPVYQWYLNNTTPVGTNSATYITSTLTTGDFVTVQLTSNALCASPTIAYSNSFTAQHYFCAIYFCSAGKRFSACSNGNAQFSVCATGDGLTYQWQEDQGGGFANLSEAGVYSGTTTNTLVITGATLG